MAGFDGKMAVALGVPLAEVHGYAEDYERMALAYLTGWTLEYVDGLGVEAAGRMWAVLSEIRKRSGPW